MAASTSWRPRAIRFSPLLSTPDSGLEHDLAPGMALLELLIGYTSLAQRETLGNRDLQPSRRHPSREFFKHFGIGSRLATLGFDVILLSSREIDDGVDPIGWNTQLDRQLHISAAEGVNESVDLSAAGGTDPVFHTVSIENRN